MGARTNSAFEGLRIGFIGCGFIARNIFKMFIARGWKFGCVAAYDLVSECAHEFLAPAAALGPTVAGRSHHDVIERSDIVVFATTTTQPYVSDVGLFRNCQLVLNISLRDLSADVILQANNFVDDVEHCLRASTSPHLAEQKVGHRHFISGTIADAVNGKLAVDSSRTTIFSPFGLGILDLALGRFVYEEAVKRNAVCKIPDFFPDSQR